MPIIYTQSKTHSAKLLYTYTLHIEGYERAYAWR